VPGIVAGGRQGGKAARPGQGVLARLPGSCHPAGAGAVAPVD
jgi:hypothetical protein